MSILLDVSFPFYVSSPNVVFNSAKTESHYYLCDGDSDIEFNDKLFYCNTISTIENQSKNISILAGGNIENFSDFNVELVNNKIFEDIESSGNSIDQAEIKISFLDDTTKAETEVFNGFVIGHEFNQGLLILTCENLSKHLKTCTVRNVFGNAKKISITKDQNLSQKVLSFTINEAGDTTTSPLIWGIHSPSSECTQSESYEKIVGGIRHSFASRQFFYIELMCYENEMSAVQTLKNPALKFLTGAEKGNTYKIIWSGFWNNQDFGRTSDWEKEKNLVYTTENSHPVLLTLCLDRDFSSPDSIRYDDKIQIFDNTNYFELPSNYTVCEKIFVKNGDGFAEISPTNSELVTKNGKKFLAVDGAGIYWNIITTTPSFELTGCTATLVDYSLQESGEIVETVTDVDSANLQIAAARLVNPNCDSNTRIKSNKKFSISFDFDSSKIDETKNLYFGLIDHVGAAGTCEYFVHYYLDRWRLQANSVKSESALWTLEEQNKKFFTKNAKTAWVIEYKNGKAPLQSVPVNGQISNDLISTSGRWVIGWNGATDYTTITSEEGFHKIGCNPSDMIDLGDGIGLKEIQDFKIIFSDSDSITHEILYSAFMQKVDSSDVSEIFLDEENLEPHKIDNFSLAEQVILQESPISYIEGSSWHKDQTDADCDLFYHCVTEKRTPQVTYLEEICKENMMTIATRRNGKMFCRYLKVENSAVDYEIAQEDILQISSFKDIDISEIVNLPKIVWTNSDAETVSISLTTLEISNFPTEAEFEADAASGYYQMKQIFEFSDDFFENLPASWKSKIYSFLKSVFEICVKSYGKNRIQQAGTLEITTLYFDDFQTNTWPTERLLKLLRFWSLRKKEVEITLPLFKYLDLCLGQRVKFYDVRVFKNFYCLGFVTAIETNIIAQNVKLKILVDSFQDFIAEDDVEAVWQNVGNSDSIGTADFTVFDSETALKTVVAK